MLVRENVIYGLRVVNEDTKLLDEYSPNVDKDCCWVTVVSPNVYPHRWESPIVQLPSIVYINWALIWAALLGSGEHALGA